MVRLPLVEDPDPPKEPPEPDLVDTLLDHYHGDARAAIEDLLADAGFPAGPTLYGFVIDEQRHGPRVAAEV